MQIREECINAKNELALHLKWKRFTEAIEEKIEYSKKP